MQLVDLTLTQLEKRTFVIEDDFQEFVSGDKFTSTLTDSGTAAVGDSPTGKLTLTPSDGTVADNDEAYLESTNETFLIADNKNMYFYARVQFTEANTDDANVLVGMASAVAADLLVDDGAGPRTTGNIICFYKVDGGTVWHLYSRNGTASTDTTTTITAGGSAFQELEFWVVNEGDGSTNVKVTFAIGGQLVYDATTNRPVNHTLAISGSTDMQIAFGVKNGGGNNQTLVIDRVYAAQVR